MLIKKNQILLITVLLLIAVTYSCREKKSTENVKDTIMLLQNESINIFNGWEIWKRSNGLVFDFKARKYRFIVIADSIDNLLLKEIFPGKDSVFYSINDIKYRKDSYPFNTESIFDKVKLFNKLKVIRVNFINDDLIMFINDNYSIIYSNCENDLRELNNSYKGYTKYNDYWYYYYLGNGSK